MITDEMLEAALIAFDGDLGKPPLTMRERMAAAITAAEAAAWQPIETPTRWRHLPALPKEPGHVA